MNLYRYFKHLSADMARGDKRGIGISVKMLRVRGTTDPCRRLVLAVLYRALVDLENGDRLVRADARKWFKSGSLESFSFLWSCDILDILPDSLPEHSRSLIY